MKKKKESGSAQINIELSDGKVIVRHTDSIGAILMTTKVYKGYWKNLWSALENKEFSKTTFRERKKQ